jgi:DDE family transposase
MQHPEGVSQWLEDLAKGLPVLSAAQRRVLAEWCFGLEHTGQCGLTTLALFLGMALGCAWQSVRQRLREWYFDAEDKCGLSRRELDVRACFAPLARWVLAHWAGRRLALALDATTLGDRLVILTVSIVYKGCAVPIAWKILRAGQKGAWKPEWLALLDLLRPAIPPDWQVIVLTDRGLYARWLFQAIARLGWHPFMRVNAQGTFHPAGADRRVRIADLAPRAGTGWAGQGVAFTGADRRLACTLLACWEEGYKDPWCILTDLAPADCAVAWYGVRGWIEQGFRTLKRGFWQWQHTRMADPARAERVWLPMAVCTFKLLAVGAALEQDGALPLWGAVVPTLRRRRPARLVRLGWLALRAAQATGHALPRLAPLPPDAWPDRPPPASVLYSSTKAVA